MIYEMCTQSYKNKNLFLTNWIPFKFYNTMVIETKFWFMLTVLQYLESIHITIYKFVSFWNKLRSRVHHSPKVWVYLGHSCYLCAEHRFWRLSVRQYCHRKESDSISIEYIRFISNIYLIYRVAEWTSF